METLRAGEEAYETERLPCSLAFSWRRVVGRDSGASTEVRPSKSCYSSVYAAFCFGRGSNTEMSVFN